MQLITQKNIKLQNMMKVFQEIYRQGSISRQTLASKTGISLMAVFFAQLPIHTKPHAEINEIHFRKSGFRLLLRPICFCFLPSFERTNRQWVIRARINAPPAKHAGMSKLIARICHLSPFRIISS